MPMTPWTYTDDMAVPFNVARFMLGEQDPNTARIPDQAITSTLATFGWQAGMSVLAQRLIVELGQEVMKSQESGGSTIEWAAQRLDGLKDLKQQADNGTLPDPTTQPVAKQIPGSMVVRNAPTW